MSKVMNNNKKLIKKEEIKEIEVKENPTNKYNIEDFISKLDKYWQDEIHKFIDISWKKDDEENIILIYSNKFIDNCSDYQYKNIIFDMKTLKPIASQYSQVISGKDNIITYINNNKFDKVIIRECFEGTQLTIFYHNDKWFVTTKKCLDANESKWNDSKTHFEMLNEILKEFEVTLDDFDTNYVYNINLIHNENNRNIGGPIFKDNKSLDLLYISEKDTLKVVEDKSKILNDKIEDIFISDEDMYKINIDYKTNDDIINVVNKYYKQLNNYVEKNDNIYLQREGKIFEFYINNIPAIGKLHTPLYEYLYHHPAYKQTIQYPKYDILHLKYILDKCKELSIEPKLLIQKLNKEKVFENTYYDLTNDKDIIDDLIKKYFTDEQLKTAMINIHYNMKNLAFLIRDVYFTFLKENDKYKDLPDSYKTIKYLIHGVYQKMLTENKSNDKVFINQDIIYNYLLTYNIHCIKELLLDYKTVTKLQYEIRGKECNSYNYIQYPMYIMKKQIKSKLNKNKPKKKIPTQFKKPNARNNYNKNHNQNSFNKNNSNKNTSFNKQIRSDRNKQMKK